MSVGNCASGLEKAHIPRNNGALDISGDSMSHSPRSRRDCGYRLSSYQNKTASTFSSGEKTITAFDLNFCRSESTHVGNYMFKAQSLLSIIVGMTYD